MLFLASLLSMLAMAEAARAPQHVVFTTLTGYFLQDDNATNPTGFDYVRFSMLPGDREHQDVY